MTATPEIVAEFLKDYRCLTESDFKCPVCGEWFAGIDNLAPYHWEACWCEKCQKYPLMPSDDIPRPNDPSSATGLGGNDLSTETKPK